MDSTLEWFHELMKENKSQQYPWRTIWRFHEDHSPTRKEGKGNHMSDDFRLSRMSDFRGRRGLVVCIEDIKFHPEPKGFQEDIYRMYH